MNNIRLSIVIPVHNEKNYIRRCLDSIKAQMDESVQVIVIDDGSTDGTTEILKEYFDVDGFEFYRTDKNKGVSFARNAGMSYAKGEYITFLDSDDAFTKGAIRTMLEATETDCMIVQFKHFTDIDGKRHASKHRNSEAGVYDITNRPKSYCMVWNKIYRRAFLQANSITFREDMKFGEDELFNIKCMLAGASIYHSRRCTAVKYFDNSMSICHRLTPLEVHKQDEVLVSLYWRLVFLNEPEYKREAIKEIIREHRSSKLYLNVGLELLK